MNKTDETTVDWHRLEPGEAVEQLQSDVQTGLTATEAAKRLSQFGPNKLAEGERRSVIKMFLSQFADFMILVLLVAAFVSGFIGEPIDTIAILIILILNALVGTVQEFRAEKAVAALRRMAAPQADVLRDGMRSKVNADQLVPGDLVILEAGSMVAADLRLLEVANLQIDESALTGESQAIEKITGCLHEEVLPLGDRRNQAFKGTSVTRGRGLGVVVATGMNTELGNIAGLLQGETGVKTPLQRRLARFGRYLALAVVAVCVVVFTSGLLQGQPILLMLLTAISLAVAAIPEALPAVITVSLALGARKLSHQQSLVRNLPAVETLGSVTFICSDKTGTLTQNSMHVDTVVAGGEQLPDLARAATGSPWTSLGQGLALCNDVEENSGKLIGEATELGLYMAASKAGYLKSDLESRYPRISELPFDSSRKMMTIVHRDEHEFIAYIKGAPEAVLAKCKDTLGGSGIEALDHKAVATIALNLAEQGSRVLAVAQRRFEKVPDPLEESEQALTLLGLVALVDPPRPEAREAVLECRRAGITPVMITGDHPGTARTIAIRLGIMDASQDVLTGQEMTLLSDEQLSQRVINTRVYARVSPEQKILIIQALQDRGEFSAMTGDGVNDAPALKRADIGIAMGEKGTDVAREAADMVLLDDNFATIVSAIHEGRRVFDNIRKFIKYTMTSNSGEIWTLFLAPFFGLPVPLLPIHILWINLITDGLPGLALATEGAEKDIMQRPPRHPQESIFANGMWQHILFVGLLIGGLSIASQAWSYAHGDEYWQTIVFTVLTFSQLFHSLAIRSEHASLFSIGIGSNKPLLGAVFLTVVLQLIVIYVPWLNSIFNTQPLPLTDLVVCFALSSLVLFAVEIEKLLVRSGFLYSRSRPK